MIGPYRPERYDGDPWHPRPFLEGEYDDLPHERDSVVLYSGISSAMFWKREYTPQEIVNQASSLKSRYIYAGNSVHPDGPVDSSVISDEDPGVYMGVLSIAYFFASDFVGNGTDAPDGAIMEVQVPSSEISTLIAPQNVRLNRRDWRVRPGNYVGRPDTQSVLDELSKDMRRLNANDSRQVYREYLRTCAETQSKDKIFQAGIIHWAVPHEIQVGSVKAVWDLAYSRKPAWESLEEYVRSLREKYPGKVPEGERGNTLRTKIKRHAQNSENVLEMLEEVENLLLNIKVNTEKAKKGRQTPAYYRRHQQEILQYLELYEEKLSQLEEAMESDLGIQVEFQTVDSIDKFLKEVNFWHEHAEGITERISEMINEEKSRAHKEDWDHEEVQKEERFEERMDQEISDDISKLPEFTPIIDYLEQNEIYEDSTGSVDSTIMNFMDAVGFKNNPET
jgi:primosomal protein N''